MQAGAAAVHSGVSLEKETLATGTVIGRPIELGQIEALVQSLDVRALALAGAPCFLPASLGDAELHGHQLLVHAGVGVRIVQRENPAFVAVLAAQPPLAC